MMLATHNMNPPVELSMNTFTDAHRKIRGADFYVLVVHASNRRIAEGIKNNFKALSGVEINPVCHDGIDCYSWRVHGMNNYGPPFDERVVYSNVPG